MKTLTLHLGLAFAGVFLTACANLLASSSSGGSVRPVSSGGSQGAIMNTPAADASGNVSTPGPVTVPLLFSYDSTIGFDKNIYPSVDLVFSRLRNEDKDVQGVLQEFMEPGYRLLEQNYGLVLPRSSLKADPKAKTLIFDGLPGPASEVTSANHTIGLLGLGVKNRRFRLTSSLDKASAGFNSLHPNKVAIKGLLSVRVEYFEETLQAWRPLIPDENGKNQFAAALTKDLRTTYYRFLNKMYGIKITSAFEGSRNE